MATILERLQRLLALAESPNEHEARNAAMLAVRLMRQHGVTFSVPPTRTTPTPKRCLAERRHPSSHTRLGTHTASRRRCLRRS